MKQYFDLSQPMQEGMSIYPGDPRPSFKKAQGIEAPWKVTELQLGTHSGTHIDSASHYFPNGKKIDEYPLSRFILEGIVISFPSLADEQVISATQLRDGLADVPEGGAVLIRTNWDRYWKTERYLRHPYLSEEAASWLVECHASLVGVDALNVDSTAQEGEQIHKTLLGNGVLIVENLANLSVLKQGRVYHFSFLPLRLAGLDGSPIRASAWEEAEREPAGHG